MSGPLAVATAELVTPGNIAGAWSWDPLVLTALISGGWWYLTGVRALWRSAGRGDVVTVGQASAFGAALVTFAVALVSPLDQLGSALFSAHMTQHVLLTLVAAPLLVLSRPVQVMPWGLPPWLRRRAGRWSGRLRRLLAHPALPAIGLGAFSLVLVSWHVPALYDAALASDAVHALEHLTMTGGAVALWAPIIRPRRTHAGVGVVLLFVSLIISGVLAALLVFSPSPWYAHPVPAAWGITRLADQQLAGAVMWVLGGALHVVAGALVLMAWLHADERSALRRERPTAPRHVM